MVELREGRRGLRRAVREDPLGDVRARAQDVLREARDLVRAQGLRRDAGAGHALCWRFCLGVQELRRRHPVRDGGILPQVSRLDELRPPQPGRQGHARRVLAPATQAAPVPDGGSQLSTRSVVHLRGSRAQHRVNLDDNFVLKAFAENLPTACIKTSKGKMTKATANNARGSDAQPGNHLNSEERVSRTRRRRRNTSRSCGRTATPCRITLRSRRNTRRLATGIRYFHCNQI